MKDRILDLLVYVLVGFIIIGFFILVSFQIAEGSDTKTQNHYPINKVEVKEPHYYVGTKIGDPIKFLKKHYRCSDDFILNPEDNIHLFACLETYPRPIMLIDDGTVIDDGVLLFVSYLYENDNTYGAFVAYVDKYATLQDHPCYENWYLVEGNILVGLIHDKRQTIWTTTNVIMASNRCVQTYDEKGDKDKTGRKKR